MKFNSLKHREAFRALTKNTNGAELIKYQLYSFTLVNDNAQGPILLLPHIPLQKPTIVKQDSPAESCYKVRSVIEIGKKNFNLAYI